MPQGKLLIKKKFETWHTACFLEGTASPLVNNSDNGIRISMKHNLLGAVSTIAIGAVAASGSAFATACISGAGPAASGNTVGTYSCSETASNSPSLTELIAQTVGPLNQWQSNASTGFVETLKQVKYTLHGSVSSTGSIANTASTAQNFTFTLGERFTFSAAAGAPSNFLASPTVVNSTGATSSYSSVASGASVPYTTGFSVGPSTTTITTLLSQWTGASTFSALVNTHTQQIFGGGGGNQTAALTTFAAPTVTVTYSYTTSSPTTGTPEPASLALLGAGLAGLGAIRRRRAK